ncbi:MAG: tetratricopeptide repeat protein [Magnetococcales bacterium]|nr:tetratricopeptide repeat protein [Magnetococcales bacterium]
MSKSQPEPVQMGVQDAIAHGVALHREGKVTEAEEVYHKVLNIEPDNPDILYLLSSIHLSRNNNGLALSLINMAIEENPNPNEHYYSNLGKIYENLGRVEDTIKAYKKVLAINPNDLNTHHQLTKILLSNGKISDTMRSVRAILQKKADSIPVLINLSSTLMQLGRLAEAEDVARHILSLQADPIAFSNLMLLSHYVPGVNLERLANYHREFAEAFEHLKPETPPVFENLPDPDRPLRVGFLSGDLRRHPVGYFIAPLLPHLDRSTIETFCFFDSKNNDDMTGHIRAGADNWFNVIGMDHQTTADLIREQNIDILFDLAGHAGTDRLITFIKKPAPIQISWAGYVGTTGLSEMDYIVADRFHIRDEEAKYYVETPLRLSDCNFVVRPPDNSPNVGPLPAINNGYVTFGSFSIPTKINPFIVNIWAKIMSQVQNSRLMLKYRAVDDEATIDRLERLFYDEGIDPSRIDFLGTTSHVDHLDHYNQIDIALDPLPYSGGMTTSEALWMGTPVITCPGETFGGRHAQSMLNCIGLTETIARDFDQYVQVAVDLAEDLPRLAAISAGLREQTANSPLMDGAAFANKFERSMRNVWHRWCDSES